MNHVCFLNQKNLFRKINYVKIAEEKLALSMTLLEAVFPMWEIVYFNLYYMSFLLTIMSLPSISSWIQIIIIWDIFFFWFLAALFFCWYYVTVLDKTFHIMGDACENSDFFVIKKRASRSRVLTKICLSRRKRRGHCFEIAPLKVGILLQIHLGKVLQLQISTFFSWWHDM